MISFREILLYQLDLFQNFIANTLVSYIVIYVLGIPFPPPPRTITDDDQEYDDKGYPMHGYTYVDPKFFKVPEGPIPMCYCGDTCKFSVSGLYQTLMMRYWMCANHAFDPTPDYTVLVHNLF